jgi:hypothetical protein
MRWMAWRRKVRVDSEATLLATIDELYDALW